MHVQRVSVLYLLPGFARRQPGEALTQGRHYHCARAGPSGGASGGASGASRRYSGSPRFSNSVPVQATTYRSDWSAPHAPGLWISFIPKLRLYLPLLRGAPAHAAMALSPRVAEPRLAASTNYCGGRVSVAFCCLSLRCWTVCCPLCLGLRARGLRVCSWIVLTDDDRTHRPVALSIHAPIVQRAPLRLPPAAPRSALLAASNPLPIHPPTPHVPPRPSISNLFPPPIPFLAVPASP